MERIKSSKLHFCKTWTNYFAIVIHQAKVNYPLVQPTSNHDVYQVKKVLSESSWWHYLIRFSSIFNFCSFRENCYYNNNYLEELYKYEIGNKSNLDQQFNKVNEEV